MGSLSEERRNYLLSELAYSQLFNKPEDAKQYKGRNLKSIIDQLQYKNIKTDGGLSQADIQGAFAEIQSDPKLSSLVFTNYENNNASGNYDGLNIINNMEVHKCDRNCKNNQ